MSKRRKDTRAPKLQVFDTPYWFERARSLASLEGRAPSPPTPHPTGLIERYEHAYHTPIEKLTKQDLLTLLGQRHEPHFIAPLALEHIEDIDLPTVSHSFEHRALLQALLTLDSEFWRTHPDLGRRLARYLRRELLKLLVKPDGARNEQDLASFIDAFLGKHGAD